MNRDNLISIFQFFLLLFLQSFLLNNINLFGFINPNFYLLFIIVYRLDGNPTLLIILGFALGLLLDLLTQGSGGHTIATLTIAFLRGTTSFLELPKTTPIHSIDLDLDVLAGL